MTCRACRAKDRNTIDLALVSGQGLRSIADQTKISKTSLIRHRNSHLSEAIASATQARNIMRGDGLLSEAVAVLDKAASLLRDAESAGDRRAALGALRECRASIELLSKLRPAKTFSDSLAPSPLQWAEWVEIAAEEFVGRPRLAYEFGDELARAFFGIVGEYLPRLGPGAKEHFLANIEALDERYS
jgi:hypothetical protein